MLDEHVNVAITRPYRAVKGVAEVLAEIVLNERAGFELKRAEIADDAQFCGQVESHKITAKIRLSQKLP